MFGNALRIKNLFSKSGSPAYPFYDDRGQLCWLEALTQEGGRLAIKQRTPKGERVLIQKDFQVRSSVHEYGGKCFCVAADQVYFNQYTDGLIYRQHLHDGSSPIQVTKAGVIKSAFADLHYNAALNAIIAVEERTATRSMDNSSRIVFIPLGNTEPITPIELISGADFYANVSVNQAGDKISWIEWQHPNMPWDETQLMCANIAIQNDNVLITQAHLIAGGLGASVCQTGFIQNGALVYAQDSNEGAHVSNSFWNLYAFQNGQTQQLTFDEAEYGEAHWVFGQQRWGQIKSDTLIAIRTHNEVDTLVEINLKTRAQKSSKHGYAGLAQLSVTNKKALCVAYFEDKPAQIIALTQNQKFQSQTTPEQWISPKSVSLPEVIKFPTKDGEFAYANFYAALKSAKNNSALIVLVHGGPTSRANTALSPLIQYFCQNGLSVLDVNHRGSTGRGRQYRQKLLGLWGEIDADDIADAIETTCQRKSLDTSRVFIRGGSAGGYAVLRALTRFPDLFCGGACYYGIGNLITLAEITHKFEGRYTDQLIGEMYDPKTASNSDSRFTTRSPIFDIDKIKSPLILFQGLDDKVVPPEVSREMVETLKQNNVAHEYIEYKGEGHGFRQAKTRIDSLTREINFYNDILGV